MQIQYPDYDRSLLSVASSVLKFYGVRDCAHKTLPEFDKLLESKPKNVIVMLFDGTGSDLLDYHLPENAFLRQKKVCDISSVFPPTTTAATTTVQTAMSPFEHSWLGWDLYFKEIDENVSVFRNRLQKDGKKIRGYNAGDRFIKLRTVYDRIREADSSVDTHYISMNSNEKVFSVKSAMRKILRISRKKGTKYIYFYWFQPDHTIHSKGTRDKSVTKIIRNINKNVEKLCSKLDDTVAVVIADHGLIDVEWDSFENHPELRDMLVRAPSIEPRALSLFVKDGCREKFAELFNKTFGDKFMLLTKQEVYDKQLFGTGRTGKKTDDFIGDFLAVATSNLCLSDKNRKTPFKGNHAGLTDCEMTVPFIVVKDKTS